MNPELPDPETTSPEEPQGAVLNLDLGEATYAMAQAVTHAQGALLGALPIPTQRLLQQECLDALLPALPFLVNQILAQDAQPPKLLEMAGVARAEMEAGTIYLAGLYGPDVIVRCERKECRPAGGTGHWQEVLPHGCTPDEAAEAIAVHVLSHHREPETADTPPA